MSKYNTLFPSEHAYRTITTLLACAESNMKEVLLPDVAYKAMIDYPVVLYWINKFEIYGFISTTRYKNRENSIMISNRHIIVHLTDKTALGRLYNYMWIQKWEEQFCADVGANKSSLTKKTTI